MLTLIRRRIDLFNIFLIITTCIAAHFLPFHLLLISYAVLGPAHYLTQISWLHDRAYFAHSRLLAPILSVFAGCLVLLFFYTGEHQVLLISLSLIAAFGVSAVWTVPPEKKGIRGAVSALAILFALLCFVYPTTGLFIALLLPTVIHVFVFTAAFMWAGAKRSHNLYGYISVIVLLGCASTFLVPLPYDTLAPPPTLVGLTFFRPVVQFLQNLLGLTDASESRMFGFLAFAYTYHYLNWFSKADVINWHKIPRLRMRAIMAVYIGTIALYSYNYVMGLFAILLLAHLHVMLEFPLNIRTFSMIMKPRENNRVSG